MVDEPVADEIRDIDVPVLVVFGAEDMLIPNPILHGGSTVRLAKKAVKDFPDGELVVLDRAGHMAQFEQAREWNSQVLRFLADHPDTPTPATKRRAKAKRGATEFVPLFDDAPAPAAPAPAPAEPETAPAPPIDPAARPADVPTPPPTDTAEPIAPMTEEGPR
jgi:hypothetical protein